MRKDKHFNEQIQSLTGCIRVKKEGLIRVGNTHSIDRHPVITELTNKLNYVRRLDTAQFSLEDKAVDAINEAF